jgi:hypothetical protein
VANGVYELELDWTANQITSIKNLKSGATSALALNWGYYTSNTGGCSYYDNGTAFGCKSKEVCVKDLVLTSRPMRRRFVLI